MRDGPRDTPPIGIAGAGAWGIALANVAARAGRRVQLWGRGAQAMRDLALTRRSAYLPGVALDDAIVVTADLTALAPCEAILVVAPAQATREVAGPLARATPTGATLVA